MVVEERISRLEEAVARFVDQSALAIAAIDEDVAEIRASNARTYRELLRLRQESDKRWEESNQRWAEWKQRWDESEARAEKSGGILTNAWPRFRTVWAV